MHLELLPYRLSYNIELMNADTVLEHLNYSIYQYDLRIYSKHFDSNINEETTVTKKGPIWIRRAPEEGTL